MQFNTMASKKRTQQIDYEDPEVWTEAYPMLDRSSDLPASKRRLQSIDDDIPAVCANQFSIYDCDRSGKIPTAEYVTPASLALSSALRNISATSTSSLSPRKFSFTATPSPSTPTGNRKRGALPADQYDPIRDNDSALGIGLGGPNFVKRHVTEFTQNAQPTYSGDTSLFAAINTQAGTWPVSASLAATTTTSSSLSPSAYQGSLSATWPVVSDSTSPLADTTSSLSATTTTTAASPSIYQNALMPISATWPVVSDSTSPLAEDLTSTTTTTATTPTFASPSIHRTAIVPHKRTALPVDSEDEPPFRMSALRDLRQVNDTVTPISMYVLPEVEHYSHFPLLQPVSQRNQCFALVAYDPLVADSARFLRERISVLRTSTSAENSSADSSAMYTSTSPMAAISYSSASSAAAAATTTPAALSPTSSHYGRPTRIVSSVEELVDDDQMQY